MKKSFLLVLCSLSITLSAQKIHIGPELGSNLIQIERTDLGRDFQPGWYSGMAFEYDFYDFFSIKTGLYYSQKRQAYSSEDTTAFELFGLIDSSFAIDGIDLNSYTSTSGRTSQHFFEIPVMASFNYKGLSVGIGAFAGFQFTARRRETVTTRTPFMQTIDVGTLLGGLLGGADSTGSGGLGGFNTSSLFESLLPKAYEETTTESTGTDGLRGFDYGLKFNIGYQPNAFGVFMSYQLGAQDYRTTFEGPKQRHQYFQFSARYLFGLGKKTTGSSRL